MGERKETVPWLGSTDPRHREQLQTVLPLSEEVDVGECCQRLERSGANYWVKSPNE